MEQEGGSLNQDGTHRISLIFYFFKLGFGYTRVHFIINFYRIQASGSSATDMDGDCNPKLLFQEKQIVAEGSKVKGRLSCNRGGMTQHWKEAIGNRA